MIFGVLVPYKRIDLGFEVLPLASAPDRMWKQDWHQRDKWTAANRARELRTTVLCMMVKNESEHIQNALRSAAGLYDQAMILDTGSTDDTMQIANDVLADLGIPTHIAQETFEPWDFATARNRSLELAREAGCDFILLMDGDETFEGHDGKWPQIVDRDAIFLDYEQDLSVPQPRLIRSWQPWEYRGRVHATPYLEEMRFGTGLESRRIVHHGVTGTTKRCCVRTR